MMNLNLIEPDRLTLLRKKIGQGYRYVDLKKGRPLTCPKKIQWIKSLAIPPSWKDVKISPTPKGHLQAIGKDLGGKTQYLYHPKWNEFRAAEKNKRLLEFAKTLPALRRKIAKDLKIKELTKEKVIAAALRVIDRTAIRVGNDASANRPSAKDRAFGLSTLRAHHVSVKGSKVQLRYRGKSGVKRVVDLESVTIGKICQELLKLKGKELFSYVSDQGKIEDLKARDLNQYIATATTGKFTAKDFRTWRATVMALECLYEMGPIEEKLSDRKYAQRRNQALKCAAEKLGNTLGMCKSHYVNPYLFEADRSGDLRTCLERNVKSRKDLEFRKTELSGIERAALCIYELSL